MSRASLFQTEYSCFELNGNGSSSFAHEIPSSSEVWSVVEEKLSPGTTVDLQT